MLSQMLKNGNEEQLKLRWLRYNQHKDVRDKEGKIGGKDH